MGLVFISVFFIFIALLIVCVLKLISLAFEGKSNVDGIGNSNSAIYYPVGSSQNVSSHILTARGYISVNMLDDSDSSTSYEVGSSSRMSRNADDFYDNLLANTLNSVDF